MTPTPTPDLQALLARLKAGQVIYCDFCSKNAAVKFHCRQGSCANIADILTECETAIRGLMERMAWKPIETAPEMQTILLWAIVWNSPVSGWCDSNGKCVVEGRYVLAKSKVTHWMHLPAAPGVNDG